jgi:transcriptional regulator with XRE-family HTH domain
MARREIEPTTELGRQLEKERRNRGLTKEAWIDLLDVSKPTYLSWLRGAKPDVESIFLISTTLGIPAATVFSWIEDDHAKGVYVSSLSRSLVAA